MGTATSDLSNSISLPGTTVICLENYSSNLPGHLSIMQGDILEGKLHECMVLLHFLVRKFSCYFMKYILCGFVCTPYCVLHVDCLSSDGSNRLWPPRRYVPRAGLGLVPRTLCPGGDVEARLCQWLGQWLSGFHVHAVSTASHSRPGEEGSQQQTLCYCSSSEETVSQHFLLG